MNGLELLLMIGKRPALYIDDGDLMSLKHFIDGFCICAQLHHIEYGENDLQDLIVMFYSFIVINGQFPYTTASLSRLQQKKKHLPAFLSCCTSLFIFKTV